MSWSIKNLWSVIYYSRVGTEYNFAYKTTLHIVIVYYHRWFIRMAKGQRWLDLQITYHYLTPRIDVQDKVQTSTADQVGRAIVHVDSCVELMNFEVDPPKEISSNYDHQCYDGQRGSFGAFELHESAKRSNWNVMKDQKFKISLEKARGQHSRKVNTALHILNQRQRAPYLAQWICTCCKIIAACFADVRS